MFCSKCGSQNRDDAAFCAACGYAMPQPQQPQPMVPYEPYAEAEQEQPNQPSLLATCGIKAANLLASAICGAADSVEQHRQYVAESKTQEQARIAAVKASGEAYCPKCYSTSITGQKKGFGIGKAVVGGALTGGLGLMAGNIGARKIRCTCMKCGYSWMAGSK